MQSLGAVKLLSSSLCQVCNMAESNCKRLDLECWPQNLPETNVRM